MFTEAPMLAKNSSQALGLAYFICDYLLGPYYYECVLLFVLRFSLHSFHNTLDQSCLRLTLNPNMAGTRETNIKESLA